MNLKTICNQLDFNLSYAKELVRDVADEQMTFTPSLGLENHPAFTLGHLAVASSMVVKYAGGEQDIPRKWIDLFHRKGPGDPTLPEADASRYPSKKELLEEFERQDELLKVVLLNADPNDFLESTKWRFAEYLPARIDCIFFMCVNHEAMHLGQLAAWRRAMKLPSALGRL